MNTLCKIWGLLSLAVLCTLGGAVAHHFYAPKGRSCDCPAAAAAVGQAPCCKPAAEQP